jgi:nucleoside-diphosphate-sugar epimerase
MSCEQSKANMNFGKIIIPGGAGLVGQNLVLRLLRRGCNDIVVLDKHGPNLAAFRAMHPGVVAEWADLAQPGEWTRYFEGARAVVMLQAQIGGLEQAVFARNNLGSTRLILDAMLGAAAGADVPYLVHVSSSVVESSADDDYTSTKAAQEKMVLESGIACTVLRPTLMFGWFDRKHLGWLARFMKKVPVFPVPGDGRYPRQPLYAGDFCEIIISCIERRTGTAVFNITGLENIDYIDIIRAIKRATGAAAPIVKIPYRLFYWLLEVWALFDRDPPFTTLQLEALVAHDEFEVIDWPGLFGVAPTPFASAIEETFRHPVYSRVALEF